MAQVVVLLGLGESAGLADADLCSRAKLLCWTVAPLDLGDMPLYIVPQSRLPNHLGGKSVCDGFTSPSLDMYVQDVIGPAWRGRGPCMVASTAYHTRITTIKIQQQIDEANRELEAAERKHYAIVNPIISELDQLKEATYEGEKAKRELWATCTVNAAQKVQR